MKARIALLGGMGYPLTETQAGMPTLKARFEALAIGTHIEVFLGSWKDRQAVYNFMHLFDGKRLYLGDSLGAGSAAQYPGDVKGEVDYAGGFQPSMWDMRASSGEHQIIVAANCKRAHAIYDPVWADTIGLGVGTYVKAHGASTRVMNTPHRGMHPDDWGWAQTLLFLEATEILKP